jgi:N-acetylglutamate synthase-like GNAT family acetyltransferase
MNPEIHIERLERFEYAALGGIADGFQPPPGSSIVVVARRDQRIIGRAFLLAPVHLEGPWVDEDYRGTTLAHRLVMRAEAEAKKEGVSNLFAYASNHVLAGYLSRIGYQKSELTVWTKEI